MSCLDERHEELIQRDIDGETSDQEKIALRDYVTNNEEARNLEAGLTKLARILMHVESVDPPADLAKSIAAALPPRRRTPASVLVPRSWLARFPALKYGYALAAGLILGLALHPFLFNQASIPPGSDLRGSMVPRIPGGQLSLNSDGVSSMISLRAADSVATLELDLESQKTVQFEVGFDSAQVEVKGLNQQISSVESFRAEPGRIIVQCEGKHCFTVLLANLKSFDANLIVGVFTSGRFDPKGQTPAAQVRMTFPGTQEPPTLSPWICN